MSTTCQPAYFQHLQVWTRSWGWMSFLVNVLRGGVRGKLQRSDRTSKEQVSTCSGARREWQWSADLGNSVEDLQRKPLVTEYHLCTTCWVLCVFMGYAGGLLGRQRLFPSVLCAIILMVLCRPKTARVGGGGLYLWEKHFLSFFLFFLTLWYLSIYKLGVDITCYKQTTV